jgi:hypothetical protein
MDRIAIVYWVALYYWDREVNLRVVRKIFQVKEVSKKLYVFGRQFSDHGTSWLLFN